MSKMTNNFRKSFWAVLLIFSGGVGWAQNTNPGAQSNGNAVTPIAPIQSVMGPVVSMGGGGNMWGSGGGGGLFDNVARPSLVNRPAGVAPTPVGGGGVTTPNSTVTNAVERTPTAAPGAPAGRELVSGWLPSTAAPSNPVATPRPDPAANPVTAPTPVSSTAVTTASAGGVTNRTTPTLDSYVRGTTNSSKGWDGQGTGAPQSQAGPGTVTSGWVPPVKREGGEPVSAPNLKKPQEKVAAKGEPSPSPSPEDEDDNRLKPEIKFVDAPYAGAMRLLAKQAGISYMESNLAEEAPITVTLKNMTPLAAFKTVADFRGFKVRVDDGVYTLSRADIDGNQTLVTKKYRICHLDPTWVEQEIANLLGIKIEKPADTLDTIPKPKETGIGGGGGGGGGGGASSSSGNAGGAISTKPRWLPSLPFDSPASTGGIRSEFGSGNAIPSALWIDRRDNAIVVRASKDEHFMVEEYIRANDHPEPLIVIDCRIVTVNDTTSHTSGLNWSQMFGNGQGQGLTANFKGFGTSINSLSGFFQGFTGGVIVSWTNASVTLQDWESTGKAKVIDSPRVVTKSGVPVSIISTTEYPITLYSTTPSGNNGGTAQQNTLSSGTQTFTWGVTMDVVPRLLANNFVDLNINPIVSDNLGYTQVGGGYSPSSSTGGNQGGGGGGSTNGTNNNNNNFQPLPVIAKRQATTTVRVQSEQTVVIGGLMQDSVADTVTGVPPLSKIPLVGSFLFGQKGKEKKRTNLLIFVTPHVIPPDEVVDTEPTGSMARAIESAKRLEDRLVRTPVKMSEDILKRKNSPVPPVPEPVPLKPKKKGVFPWDKKPNKGNN